ncbi:cytochrome P450 84A4-like [Zingiber officinale]|uniref:cytochrome P450 84A4-like n=1 Tax=Zingiber officinale TaxID=94328 RepID=UPI001C4B9F41|nr:cytochrome P450 84A4-like [Zingiber officinale]
MWSLTLPDEVATQSCKVATWSCKAAAASRGGDNGISDQWVMAELIKNPDKMSRVQEELPAIVILDRASEGDALCLCLHQSIPLLLHKTMEESQVARYLVLAWSRVMVNVWEIGQQMSVLKEARAFRPTRFVSSGEAATMDFKGNFFEFLPFGLGQWPYMWMQLGLYGVELAVKQMAYCFEWSLAN